ncbi:hypothetical protein L1987_07459 [Smallanthus sonchifolius]|uniref:Uncharacterized protein n=1 Tax=Smallanthus sonchifolius TaxID=185202 RepID=A0ACB9K0K6_9ASTR|nr:hypothetical protein L1987_07459 [Smallanthus sonchifolius]
MVKTDKRRKLTAIEDGMNGLEWGSDYIAMSPDNDSRRSSDEFIWLRIGRDDGKCKFKQQPNPNPQAFSSRSAATIDLWYLVVLESSIASATHSSIQQIVKFVDTKSTFVDEFVTCEQAILGDNNI